MDWALAIERNRQPLLRIVTILCSMIGLGEGSFVARVSRPLHRAVLAVLRPAEAAVRTADEWPRPAGWWCQFRRRVWRARCASSHLARERAASRFSSSIRAGFCGVTVADTAQAPGAGRAPASSTSHSIPAFPCSSAPRSTDKDRGAGQSHHQRPAAVPAAFRHPCRPR